MRDMRGSGPSSGTVQITCFASNMRCGQSKVAFRGEPMIFWPDCGTSAVVPDRFSFTRGSTVLAAEASRLSNNSVVNVSRFSYFDPFLQSITRIDLLAFRWAQSLYDNQVMSNCKQQCDVATTWLAAHGHEPKSAVAGHGVDPLRRLASQPIDQLRGLEIGRAHV